MNYVREIVALMKSATATTPTTTTAAAATNKSSAFSLLLTSNQPEATIKQTAQKVKGSKMCVRVERERWEMRGERERKRQRSRLQVGDILIFFFFLLFHIVVGDVVVHRLSHLLCPSLSHGNP